MSEPEKFPAPAAVRPEPTPAPEEELDQSEFDHWADLRDEEVAEAAPIDIDPSRVAVLVVAHEGSTWLPNVLTALSEQTATPGQLLGVDTGSTDGSGGLLDDAFGHDAVRTLSAGASFGEAVDTAIGVLRADIEWLWILHDDSAPAPDALQRLLERTVLDPGVAAVGAKLREWPSLKRLLEVGVTISGTARRETGLERGEYDQGQYDVSRRVLAVNSAGMLVRPEVVRELGGFSADLPVLGGDLDLGWRAAAAGHRIVVEPDAVVFHAEASSRGIRDTTLVDKHSHAAERRAQVFVVLANASRRLFVFAYLRLIVGAFVRSVGFLLTRRPRPALDELSAVFAVVLRPGLLRRARAQRRRTREVPDAELRPLLAPWWLPFRHGLDAISDLAASLTTHASDVADRRRDAKLAAERERVAATRSGSRIAHPLPGEEGDELGAESGWLARYLTSPVALTLTGVVLLLLVGAREAFGQVSGPAMAPTPDTTGAWWSLHLASWHPIGTGTDVPAPPYVAPLALLAWLLPGGPATAVSVVLILSLPFALWGAWRLLGVATRLVDPAGASPWLLGVAATTYALLPATTGAWSEGRFGVVLGAAILPWFVHAALGFADPERERRWRAGWRTGLLLTLLVALVPFAWWLVVGVVGSIAIFAAALNGPSRLLERDVRTGVLAPVGVALGVPIVVLSPWLVPTILNGDLVALVGEAGRLPYAVLSPFDVLAGHVAPDGGPSWIAYLLIGGALLALLLPATRIAVVGCWAIAFAVLAPASIFAIPVFSLAPGDTPSGVGFAVIVVLGVAIVAVALGALGLRHLLSTRDAGSGVRRIVPALPIVALAATAAAALLWFVGPGASLAEDDRDAVIPAYMAQASENSPSYGVLEIDGTIRAGVTFAIRREDGLRLGEEEIAAFEPADAEFVDNVRELISNPSSERLDRIRDAGISYIVQSAPGDPAIRATLDSIAGLEPASAPDGTRAWELAEAPAADAVDDAHTSASRWILLAIQGIGFVVVLVMAGPSRGRKEELR